MPKRSTGESLFFQVAGQASGKNVVGSPQDLFYKADRRSPGFRSYRIAQGLTQRTTLVFHSRFGSSDLTGTGGSLSAYRGSGFRRTGSPLLIALESTDRRNAESAFGTEPTVSALGHIKRACKRGWLPCKYRAPPRPFILRTRVARSGRVGVSAVGSSWGESFMLFNIAKPRTPIALKA
jgi:hypothetical protein